jgi:hypothetical protein
MNITRNRPPPRDRANGRLLETLLVENRTAEARAEALRMKDERERRQAEWNARQTSVGRSA